MILTPVNTTNHHSPQFHTCGNVRFWDLHPRNEQFWRPMIVDPIWDVYNLEPKGTHKLLMNHFHQRLALKPATVI